MIRALSTSITRTNSIEEGPLYEHPQARQILCHGFPLNSILVLAVDSSSEVQSLHLALKPKRASEANKNCQETESKTFATSIFRTRQLALLACRALHVN